MALAFIFNLREKNGAYMKNEVKTKTIKQKVLFKTTPHEVYEMIMDSKKHSEFSGESAKIARKVGSKFTAYGGWIEGKNLELVKDRKIVQLWRGADWPKGHYSVATFKFTKLKNGTSLEFTQTGVPVEMYKDISDGWKEHYWEKMKLLIK
jgi:activator of HSP90 ATPase